MTYPKVSIIIPCRKLEEAEECIEGCQKLEYPNYEIIVLPNRTSTLWVFAGVRCIPTAVELPSHKRDIGIKYAEGEIIAFLDADASPFYLWLNAAVSIMEKEISCGVCGPGIIPPEASEKERVTDWILRRMPYKYRVTMDKYRLVDDYPTFNLLLWKHDVEAVGGFHCDYLTGEDTLLCKKVIAHTGKMISYSPRAAVYHHRREVFMPFFRQVATYGKHRGYFFKVFPSTSRRVAYILPTLFWGAVCFILSAWWVISALR